MVDGRMNPRLWKATVLACVAATALGLSACGALGASDDDGQFPARNIEIVVPYPAGGPTDIVARSLAEALNKDDGLDGRRAQVTNLSGAAGATAASYLTSAKADGHTIGVFPNSAFTIQTMLKDQPYSRQQFDFLSNIAQGGLVVVVPKDSPYDTFEEFGEAAMADPGALTIGNPGSANLSETEARLVLDAADYPARVVNFEGSAPAMTAMLGGDVSAVITALGSVTAQIESGDFKGILFIGEAPEGSALADIPTLTDSGLGELELPESPNLLVVPNKVPVATKEKLQKLVEDAASSSEYQSILGDMGMTSPLSSSDEISTLLDHELDWYTTSADHLCGDSEDDKSALCLAWTARPGA